jgi:hypothetical protein
MNNALIALSSLSRGDLLLPLILQWKLGGTALREHRKGGICLVEAELTL